ncbi:hypothetical protein, variant 1 [Aphanomyces invadans]|uniref:Protein root UVB sensitive/RUS domain-containing protein n=1 Tax=Aphanomyces invadans TaxID=157072 RepID=A0A024TH54_9STRA|nr:hypothetical protein, variant 1 [Aphanomyces invadans]ETV93485.1 hypothetical protein, variant 1 [Aphanomyces invadans]|eukprot:XP_008877827.1 hypothetical protein, variant 1 [Aphanomyces invadans]
MLARKVAGGGKARGGVGADDAAIPRQVTFTAHDIRSSHYNASPTVLEWSAVDGRVSSVKGATWRVTNIVQLLRRELFDMFLPFGYPDSVSDEYLTFQMWDTCQAMCSYLRGVLATQSVLESVGVGKDSVTPLAAALQWVMRDGSGMLGGLFFAYIVGPKFDANVKFWRLYADVINDFGLTLDMLAPFFPLYVTEILCVSSVCKAMCGVAAGATRSSLTAHFAKHENMADIAAKEGSQETFVNMVGLVSGMYFANAVNQSRTTVWMAFIFLTGFHVVANYLAVTTLCIPTLNVQRAYLAIQRYRSSSTKQSLSVVDINHAEVIWGPRLPISMGHHLPAAHVPLGPLLAAYRDEQYVLWEDAAGHIHVFLSVHAKPVDELRAFYHVTIVLTSPAKGSGALAMMQQEFPLFYETMHQHEWKLTHIPLGTGYVRFNWE